MLRSAFKLPPGDHETVIPLSMLQVRHMQGPHEHQPHIYSLISPLPTWVQENPKIELLYLVVVFKKKIEQLKDSIIIQQRKRKIAVLNWEGWELVFTAPPR